jgi:hypothetical protein
VNTVTDTDGYRAAREARASTAERTQRPVHNHADDVTRMVDAAVYRYEHAAHGRHHHEEAPTESAEESTADRG